MYVRFRLIGDERIWIIPLVLELHAMFGGYYHSGFGQQVRRATPSLL
jgi:hypothetical protein